MADRQKLRVEVGSRPNPEPRDETPAPGAAPASEGAQQPTDSSVESGPADGSATSADKDSASSPDATTKLVSWLGDALPRNRYAVVGGAFGLALALLLFAIGLLKTLVIAALVLGGVACGQYLDGDPKLIKLIQHLTRRH